eukprot:2825552-Amphidinium_carterae.1
MLAVSKCSAPAIRPNSMSAYLSTAPTSTFQITVCKARIGAVGTWYYRIQLVIAMLNTADGSHARLDAAVPSNARTGSARTERNKHHLTSPGMAQHVYNAELEEENFLTHRAHSTLV